MCTNAQVCPNSMVAQSLPGQSQGFTCTCPACDMPLVTGAMRVAATVFLEVLLNLSTLNIHMKVNAISVTTRLMSVGRFRQHRKVKQTFKVLLRTPHLRCRFDQTSYEKKAA